MISCLPIVVLFFILIASEPAMFYLDTFEIEISSGLVMNTRLLLSFTTVLSVFWFVKRDLEQIEQVLFPQILLDDDTRMREYDQLQNQCGEVPPPLRMPEAINLQHAMAS